MKIKNSKLKTIICGRAEREQHVCLRCGLCCQDCGDFAGDAQTDSGLCSGLAFEGKTAVCLIQDMKPDVCKAYPFPDMDGGKCQRELAEAKAGQMGLFK